MIFADNTLYEGGQSLANYSVANYKLPVFVREGAVIPLYPESYFDKSNVQIRPRDPLYLDIYPHATKTTVFSLFEDDGLTYQFKQGKFNKTVITCEAANDNVDIRIKGCAEGSGYADMPQTRTYWCIIHRKAKPESVFIENQKLEQFSDTTALNSAQEGWCMLEGSGSRLGEVHVKTRLQPFDKSFTISFNRATKISEKKHHATLKALVTVSGGAVHLSVDIDQSGDGTVTLFDLKGQTVAAMDVQLNEGVNRICLPRVHAAIISKVYLVKIATPSATFTKMIIVPE
ncbi:MAG: DUF5110 domain-containing protein [Chitinivibrionales bacterium]|nr:DUF5110 domain-containing protein [Chitinivibrionales bacterium]